MHSLTTALLLAAGASMASADKQMEIDYYSDSNCNSRIGQVDVTWATRLWGGKNNCYNYSYGNSVNIANCWGGECQCNFFYKSNCQGTAVQKADYRGNCVGGASQLKSFACYY